MEKKLFMPFPKGTYYSGFINKDGSITEFNKDELIKFNKEMGIVLDE